ncbi:MAG: SURF1 family protein [bacterium]
MSIRTIVFCVFAVGAATVFSRLGFWQVGRLRQRQASNAVIVRQQGNKPMALSELPHDTALSHYRPASVTGVYDFDHELVLSGRTRRGSPGVDLLTPVKIAGSDTAVLVNRGWVYSPNASQVDRGKWREADTARVTGYVQLFSTDTAVLSAIDPRLVRHVSHREVAAKIPYPVAPFYLVAVGDTADLRHPARLEMPELDEGSHRSYAFQWFAFATIALVGAGIVVYREQGQASSEGE